MPEDSLKGKLVLVLDCGCRVRATWLLPLHCKVVQAAGGCAADGPLTTLRLPCVSGLQACLLLQVRL